MAPLEDDSLFRETPGRARAPKRPHERVPYHEMTDEERRAAWAALRAAQSRRARRGRAVPLYWFLASLVAFGFGFVLSHYGSPGAGAVLRWVGLALVGFALVSLGRGLFGRSAGRKDDFAPPGF